MPHPRRFKPLKNLRAPRPGAEGWSAALPSKASGCIGVLAARGRRGEQRALARPIYRDALLIGEFLAGIVTLAITSSRCVASGGGQEIRA
jgi:hypothetical protein